MITEPKCSKRFCRFFLGVKNDGDESTERAYCAAYPDRIPDDIAYGEDEHLEIRNDQENDIIYEEENNA